MHSFLTFRIKRVMKMRALVFVEPKETHMWRDIRARVEQTPGVKQILGIMYTANGYADGTVAAILETPTKEKMDEVYRALDNLSGIRQRHGYVFADLE